MKHGGESFFFSYKKDIRKGTPKPKAIYLLSLLYIVKSSLSRVLFKVYDITVVHNIEESPAKFTINACKIQSPFFALIFSVLNIIKNFD